MRLALLLLAPLLASMGAPSVVVVVIDDWGVDRCGAYAEHPRPGRTPNIDALAAQGMLFRNAWTYTVCSPTRAAMLTGRYGFRTGIGKGLKTEDPYGLPLAELTFAEALPPAYVSAAVGKWHVGVGAQGPLNPNNQGFDVFLGHLFNVENSGGSYFAWDQTVNGITAPAQGYLTTTQVDDAIRMVRQLPEPFVLYVALQAPHTPRHAPPAHLHSYELEGDPDDTPGRHYKAMLEAADTELGRLFDAIDLGETYLFVLGDNGTPAKATSLPFNKLRAKGFLYEGGINVPFIAAGPGIPAGSESPALVGAVDLFATILELATGSATTPTDSVSLVPVLADPRAPHRDFVYAERFDNGPPPVSNHRRAIRGARYKLIDRPNTGDELFDLELDPFETVNLKNGPLTQEQQAALDALRAELERIGG